MKSEIVTFYRKLNFNTDIDTGLQEKQLQHNQTLAQFKGHSTSIQSEIDRGLQDIHPLWNQ